MNELDVEKELRRRLSIPIRYAEEQELKREEFYVDQKCVGNLIGKHGRKLNFIAKTHNVDIFVFPVDGSQRLVRIYGPSDSAVKFASNELQYASVQGAF